MRSFVYVIGRGDCPVKIGHAVDPLARLSGLQVGCPDELTLRHALDVPDNVAHLIESAAHHDLIEHRLRGEWFSVQAERAFETVTRLAPSIIDADRDRLARSRNLLHRLGADHDLSEWSEAAISHYRSCLIDHRRRADLEGLNSLILKGCGMEGLAVFRAVIVNRADLDSAAYRAPGLRRKAEAALVRAINVLAGYHAGEREQSLLDIIAGKAA